MGLSNGSLKPIGRKMRVNLRRGQARMPEQLLNLAQVRATLEKIGRKGVAHRMRRDVGRDTGERRQHMEPSSEHSGTHAIAARRNKQRMQAGCGFAALCLREQRRSPLLDTTALPARKLGLRFAGAFLLSARRVLDENLAANLTGASGAA